MLFLHYFYYYCLKLYVLFNIVLVQVRKEAGKQINHTGGFMNAQVQLHNHDEHISVEETNNKVWKTIKLNPKMPMKILFHYPPTLPSI